MLRTILCILISSLVFSCSHQPQDNQIPVEQDDNYASINKQGDKIVALAHSLLGSPYKYGGATPNGFDCSGLVFYIHGKLGIRTARTSLQQYKTSKALRINEIAPGDLVFFKLNTHTVSHVGIFIGENRFIHAPKRGKAVSVNTLNDEFWKPKFVGAGRLY